MEMAVLARGVQMAGEHSSIRDVRSELEKPFFFRPCEKTFKRKMFLVGHVEDHVEGSVGFEPIRLFWQFIDVSAGQTGYVVDPVEFKNPFCENASFEVLEQEFDHRAES